MMDHEAKRCANVEAFVKSKLFVARFEDAYRLRCCQKGECAVQAVIEEGSLVVRGVRSKNSPPSAFFSEKESSSPIIFEQRVLLKRTPTAKPILRWEKNSPTREWDDILVVSVPVVDVGEEILDGLLLRGPYKSVEDFCAEDVSAACRKMCISAPPYSLKGFQEGKAAARILAVSLWDPLLSEDVGDDPYQCSMDYSMVLAINTSMGIFVSYLTRIENPMVGGTFTDVMVSSLEPIKLNQVKQSLRLRWNVAHRDRESGIEDFTENLFVERWEIICGIGASGRPSCIRPLLIGYGETYASSLDIAKLWMPESEIVVPIGLDINAILSIHPAQVRSRWVPPEPNDIIAARTPKCSNLYPCKMKLIFP